MPVGTQARNDYFNSLYHSAAVVGINTSAMLEAAVVGRRSFTVLLGDIREGQEGSDPLPTFDQRRVSGRG